MSEISTPQYGNPDERWRDLAGPLGYFVPRLLIPKFDGASAIGQLLAQDGFVACRRDTGLQVLFADVLAVPQSDIAQLEERYGLRIHQYPGLRNALEYRLLEITLSNTTRAWSLFRTRRHNGPIQADTPSKFFQPAKKEVKS